MNLRDRNQYEYQLQNNAASLQLKSQLKAFGGRRTCRSHSRSSPILSSSSDGTEKQKAVDVEILALRIQKSSYVVALIRSFHSVLSTICRCDRGSSRVHRPYDLLWPGGIVELPSRTVQLLSAGLALPLVWIKASYDHLHLVSVLLPGLAGWPTLGWLVEMSPRWRGCIWS